MALVSHEREKSLFIRLASYSVSLVEKGFSYEASDTSHGSATE